MKTMSKAGVFLLASGLVLALFATAAEAGNRKVTRDGPRGGSVEKSWSRGGGTATREVNRYGRRGGSVEKSWSRGGGSATRQVTRTGRNGASVERSATRGGGTATRDVTRTALDGRTFERSTERVIERENQSVTRSSTADYPDGTTSQGSRTITRNDDGSTSIEGEWTNREGETKTYTGTWSSE